MSLSTAQVLVDASYVSSKILVQTGPVPLEENGAIYTATRSWNEYATDDVDFGKLTRTMVG